MHYRAHPPEWLVNSTCGPSWLSVLADLPMNAGFLERARGRPSPPDYRTNAVASPYDSAASTAHCVTPAAIGAQPARPRSWKLVCSPTPAMPTHRSHRSPRWISCTHSFGSQPVLLSAAKITNTTRNHGTADTRGRPVASACVTTRTRQARKNTTGASRQMRTSFTTVAMAVDSLLKPEAAATT